MLYEIACPVTRDSATETVQCAAQTPRVIGGGRALFDELRNADERSEPAGGLPLPKSPLGITPLKAELLGALDPVPTEPITVALVRTIQNAYMLHRQQGKEVDEEDLARLLGRTLQCPMVKMMYMLYFLLQTLISPNSKPKRRR